jgi:ABC-type glycerol-3-phosphate transport system substrate-binding protein
MKKHTFILALSVALTLTACGTGSTTNQSTGSAAVENVTDTTHQKDTTDYKIENAKRLAELKDSTAK